MTTPTPSEATADADNHVVVADEPKVKLSIHALMEANQSAHGLVHEDYKQYHMYCTRRLSRLRHGKSHKRDFVHASQYVQGKKLRRHEYCPRDVPPLSSTLLEVTLLQAERAWAHANELKAVSAKRQHSLKRLKKAVKLAEQLLQLSQEGGDERTLLEAKAYAGWMRGNLSLEKADWKSACEEYGMSMSTCRTLSSFSNNNEDDSSLQNLELHDLFMARADNALKPLLRYCQYELVEAGGNLQDLKHQTEEQNTTTTTSSNTQRRTSTTGGHSISFRGNDLPIEQKQIRLILVKADGLQSDFSEKEHYDDAKFMQLLSAYDDASGLLDANLVQLQGIKAGPAVNQKRFEIESLQAYCKYQKLQLVMKRDESMIQTLLNEQDDQHTSKRLEEIAHLYDTLLQDAQAVCLLKGWRSGQEQEGEEEDDEFLLQAKANVLRIRALRCYYVARLHGAHGDLTKCRVLLEQSSLLAKRAAEEIYACDDMEHADEYLQELQEELPLQINAAKCRVEAQAVLLAAQSSAAGSAAVEGFSLLQQLQDFSVSSKLGDVPPAPIPMPVKPVFFDIAWNHCVGGDVSDKLLQQLDSHLQEYKPQEESKGLLGWFRR